MLLVQSHAAGVFALWTVAPGTVIPNAPETVLIANTDRISGTVLLTSSATVTAIIESPASAYA
jgi:hypothetical protein